MTVPPAHRIYRPGLIILLVVAVYVATLNHGFVWDDPFIIVNNPLLEKLGNIPQMLLSEDTIEESTGYYRPVTYVSFALERAIWGINPLGYHVTNLVLHCLVVLLFYLAVTAMFNRERLAFIASLFFALHPVAGETVNFLAGGRNTLLSACFGLLSLLFYVKKKRFPAVACFTLAIFSKEFALLLPVVFLLYDSRCKGEKIRIRDYSLYLVAIGGYLVLRSVAVQKANFLGAINLPAAMTAPSLLVKYALNMIWPFQLKVLYSVNPTILSAIAGAVFITAAAGIACYFRKHDEAVFSMGWVFLFLLPVINIIPLHTTTVMADRYAYFSLMGFALCLAAVVCRVTGRAVTIGIVILCTLYSLVAFNRSRFWKDDIEFFTRMTIDAPETFVGFKNLGLAYYKKGEIVRAMNNLEIADSKRDIPSKNLIGDAYIFWKENMPDKAEKSLLKVIELEPLNPEPYLVLMLMDEQYGRKIRAQEYRDKLLEMGHVIDKTLTDRTIALCRTGEIYLAKRQYVDAEIYFWQALKINPGYIPALIDMGSLRAEQGDVTNSIQYLNKALAIDPLNATAHFNLSILYKMQGRFADAQGEMVKFREAEAVSKQGRGGAKP